MKIWFIELFFSYCGSGVIHGKVDTGFVYEKEFNSKDVINIVSVSMKDDMKGPFRFFNRNFLFKKKPTKKECTSCIDRFLDIQEFRMKSDIEAWKKNIGIINTFRENFEKGKANVEIS